MVKDYMPGEIPTKWQLPISTPGELDRFLSSEGGPFLYRGQCNPRWTPDPGIERGRNTEDARQVDVTLPLHEKRIITESRESLARVGPALTEDNNVEWLNRIQHYGGKTRLLDVTSDPLIAIWFALDDQSNECQPRTQVAVWRFRTEFVLSTARDRLQSEPDRFSDLLNRHLQIEMEKNPYNAVVGWAVSGLAECGRGFTDLPEAIINLLPDPRYGHDRTIRQKASFLVQTGVLRNFFSVLMEQFHSAGVPEDIAQFIIKLDTTMRIEIRQRIADAGIDRASLLPKEPVPRSSRCVG